MENQMLLRDPKTYPSDEILKVALGEPVYYLLDTLLKTITGPEYGLTIDWRFYNDGKSWLCKVQKKKKTIFWLSVWDGFFKTSFYFMEKHGQDVDSLSISKRIREEFAGKEHIGRLIPMVLEIDKKDQIQDLMTVISFKMSLK